MKEKLLDIYTDYLISQNKYAMATGLSELLCGELSHDQITTKGEVHISHLSTEIILHILSFLKPYSIETGYYDELLEIDEHIESLEIVEVTGNNYCILS